MGLWLMCPGCKANNLLYSQVCANCGQSLENLLPGERVYVVEPGWPATPKPTASSPAAPAAKKSDSPAAPAPLAAAKAEKKPKRPRKKKD